jgi:hypothetical protein
VSPVQAASGADFTLVIRFTARTKGVAVVRYTINKDGSEVFASSPQMVEVGSGLPVLVTKTLGAAHQAGAYTIRVLVALDEAHAESETILTVTSPGGEGP